ncbi:proline--tRNA ligase [Solwaraspora sp. WMMA2080]|uniref:proline--tRNA ligase n=1 Tax=unclassified Solwaraspora TaxID=2627926 RepID=UPI00248CEBE4|nr:MULTISPECIES: proline--tRNA ligase [unclassified Solwaraspora]WBB98501.1 proline--tRNA ligase [Solwaraspora sp. WMMA2059]WBC22946.1 proline--tRNA ligase [Solwaraspora sp. WMMA2080]
MARVLTPRAEDFPRWYQDLIAKAQLADNGPVRGTMVIRPAGYAIWERMQSEMDNRIKAAGAENAYFPLFIPESYLRREAEHVEGFSPELAVVTHGGGKQLAEPVVVRPTSETVIGEFMAKWVDSYRDLPLLLNQWANVVRWELRPRVFLRTSEFLWQEGHTAHADEADARAYARRILHEVYEDFMVNVLGIPVLVGRKTARERFAGATSTYTLEGMMADGKALQLGTSHELGQNFARAFDITYTSAERAVEHAWTTSWGVSTRMLGGLIMVHGDDNGLRVPPRLAPVQAYVMVVKAGDGVAEAAAKLRDALRDAGVRVGLDDRVDTPFGRRAVDAELKGYPVRVEVGPRDLAAGNAVLVRRTDGSKTPVPVADVVGAVRNALDADQQRLYDQALTLRQTRTVEVGTLADAVAAAATGWARVPWSVVGPAGEAEVNAQGVTVRCLLRPDGSVPDSDDEPDLVAVLARSY